MFSLGSEVSPVSFFRSVIGCLKSLVLGSGVDLAQKRNSARLACNIPVLCHFEDSSVPAHVIDLGLHGMRIVGRGKVKFELGNILAVSYRGESRVKVGKVVAKVVWVNSKSDKWELGVEYVGGEEGVRSWVDHLLDAFGFSEESVFERRKFIRVQAGLPGVLVMRSGETLQGMVLNLGLQGALLDISRAIPLGVPLTVRLGPEKKLEQLKLAAKVRHCRPSAHQGKWQNGVVFTELDPDKTRLLGEYIIYLIRENG